MRATLFEVRAGTRATRSQPFKRSCSSSPSSPLRPVSSSESARSNARLSVVGALFARRQPPLRAVSTKSSPAGTGYFPSLSSCQAFMRKSNTRTVGVTAPYKPDRMARLPACPNHPSQTATKYNQLSIARMAHQCDTRRIFFESNTVLVPIGSVGHRKPN